VNVQLNINKSIRLEMNLNITFNICLNLYTFPFLQLYKFITIYFIANARDGMYDNAPDPQEQFLDAQQICF